MTSRVLSARAETRAIHCESGDSKRRAERECLSLILRGMQRQQGGFKVDTPESRHGLMERPAPPAKDVSWPVGGARAGTGELSRSAGRLRCVQDAHKSRR